MKKSSIFLLSTSILLLSLTVFAISHTFNSFAPDLPELRENAFQRGAPGATAVRVGTIHTGIWKTRNLIQTGRYRRFTGSGTKQYQEVSFRNEPVAINCSPRYVNGQWLSCPTPLLIDLGQSDFSLTKQNRGVFFDFNGDGQETHTHWVAKDTDDAFLALDLNLNGTIDNGTELFGDSTTINSTNSLASDGYEALAQYDINKDGKINKVDSIWNSLLLWNDVNGNGISEDNELSFVKESGLKKFILKVKTDLDNIDLNGSLLQDWSWVRTNESFRPRRVKMVDVYFAPIENTQYLDYEFINQSC